MAARASGGRKRVLAILGVVALVAVAAGSWWLLRPPFASEYEEAAKLTEVMRFHTESGALPTSVELVSTAAEAEDSYTVASRMANVTHLSFSQHSRNLAALLDSQAVDRDPELRGLADELSEAYDELFGLFAAWEDDGYAEVAWMTVLCSPEPAHAQCAEALESVHALSPQPQLEVLQQLVQAADTGDREQFLAAKETMRAEGEAALTKLQERAAAVDDYVDARTGSGE